MVIKMEMEAAGIEPASGKDSMQVSTRVVFLLILAGCQPKDRHTAGASLWFLRKTQGKSFPAPRQIGLQILPGGDGRKEGG